MAVSEATSDYKYLFVNLAPYCDPNLRLKSHVHDPDHQIVYLV